MLSVLRKKAGSWIIKVLSAVIVLVFVFWGGQSFLERRKNTVATVNGTIITRAEYNEQYRNLYESYRQRFGGQVNTEMMKMFQLEQQALDNIIERRLLLDEAERVGFQVSEEELRGVIAQVPVFQRDGAFSERLYQAVLSRNKLTPEGFEFAQRNGLLTQKLQSYVTSSAKVSDGEAEAYFRWQNASANIDYVHFDPNTYEGIRPSPQEVQAYYDDHKGRYKTDAAVKIRYVNFEARAFLTRVDVTDEEIQAYYEARTDRFRTQKTVEARHILIGVGQDAPDETVEEQRNKALDILAKANAGEDFSELAKEYSDGPSASRGGRLGAFKREAMEAPFSERAFAMEVGEISDPVRTRHGWHIIKVDGINEASRQPLDEVREEIKKSLTDRKTKNIAYDEAEEVYDVSFQGDDLVEAAGERFLPVLTSDFFTMKEPDKALKQSRKVAQIAFDLPVMEISEVIDYDGGYYIIQVLEKRPERIAELEDVKDTVKTDLINEMQEEKAKADAEAFLVNAEASGSLVDEGEKMGLDVGTTGFFKRTDPVPGIGNERAIAEAAFSLSEGKQVSEGVIKGMKGYYVISLKESKEPGSSDFEREKDKTKETLLGQKRQRAFDAMLAQLRTEGEITIADGFLQ